MSFQPAAVVSCAILKPLSVASSHTGNGIITPFASHYMILNTKKSAAEAADRGIMEPGQVKLCVLINLVELIHTASP